MSAEDTFTRPGLLSATALASIERAINTTLATDPASQQQLAKHAGRLTALRVSFPPMSLFILIVEDGVELYHHSDAQPDVSIAGHPLDLAATLLNWRTRPALIGGPISISGNQQLLQDLQRIAQQLDIDWGALLAPITGNEIAQQLDHGARRLFGWARQTASRLTEQLGDYVGNESGLLPERRQVYEFGQDVDALRLDVDRLEARIGRLNAMLSPATKDTDNQDNHH